MDEILDNKEVIEQCSISPIDKKQSSFFSGFDIYFKGFLFWRIWLFMAVMDLKRRYRRTIIGPFWVTLSMSIFIASIGIIFPVLWQTDVKTYLPFFSSGYIVWTFISTLTTEACNTFVDAAGLIKQTALPYSVYANNTVTRNIIVLLHHLSVYVLITFIFSVPINFNTLLFIPGMFLLCITGSWLCILLGFISCRYRDMRQIISSLLQVAMFVTPIFWSAPQLGDSKKARFFIEANPLYHFIQVIRAPLLGQKPSIIDWLVVIIICALGWSITVRMLGKYKKHLVFWL